MPGLLAESSAGSAPSRIEVLRYFADSHGAAGHADSPTILSHPDTSNGRQWENVFEWQRFGFFPIVDNTIVIELERPNDELLAEIGRYHRRHIPRQERSGTIVETPLVPH